jgi:6-pyruvoyl-tetrahydropterin synthase related domain
MTNSCDSGSGLRPKFAPREWTVAAGVSLLVAVAVVSPFFFLGTASGHDISFHMASWLDTAGQWKQGILLPRWTEWANFGYGEPRFIFYPPLSWVLGGVLGSLIPWSAVAATFVVAVQTLAGISAFALLRRLVDSRWAALFAAACFAANPYALVIIYARSDFAELLAMAFFPLLFGSALRLCGFLEAQTDRSHRFRAMVLFAVAFSAVWLSNAPAAVIATYSVTFLLLVAAIRQGSPNPLWHGGCGILLGFGLAGFYLIPAIYEQRWVNIASALAGGLTPSENFLYATTTDAEHDAFNRVASNIAVVLSVWCAAGALAAWRARWRGGFRLVVLLPLVTLTAGVLLLMLPVTSLLWRFLPELRFVQFPWRWMSVLALCSVIFMAATVNKRFRWVWLAVAVVAAASCGRYIAQHTWWDTEDMPTLEVAMASGEGFEGTDEYDPLGDDRSELAPKRPRAWFVSETGQAEERSDERIFVDRWTAEHRALRSVTTRKARIAIRLLDYPAWQVFVNGRLIKPRHGAETNQMILPLEAGESRIEISFVRTWDRTVGGWVSLLTVCGLMALGLWTRKPMDAPL